MAVFTNLGFEDVGASEGLADGWATATTGGAAVLADFGGGGAVTPTETFESGWDNDDYLFVVDPMAIALANFNTGLNTTPYEDFEVEWLNDVYLFALGSGIAAGFTGGGDIETFESGWDTNEDYLFTLGPGDIIDAVFTGVGSYESFEVGWQNDTYYSSLTGPTTAASFDEGASDTETFAAVLAPFGFSVASSVFQAAGHPLADDNRVQFAGPGLPPEIVPNLTYYVINAAASTWQVSLTMGGAAVTVSDSSSTTMTIFGDPAVYWTESYDA